MEMHGSMPERYIVENDKNPSEIRWCGILHKKGNHFRYHKSVLSSQVNPTVFWFQPIH